LLIGRCFYIWKRTYEEHGEAGLVNKSRCPVNLPLHVPRVPEPEVAMTLRFVSVCPSSSMLRTNYASKVFAVPWITSGLPT